jgi:hypothetical protein
MVTLDSDGTCNLAAGTVAPMAGIYVVSHRDPPHAAPHEVLITVPMMILPKCKACTDVRFSLKSRPPIPIEDHAFFSHIRAWL